MLEFFVRKSRSCMSHTFALAHHLVSYLLDLCVSLTVYRVPGWRMARPTRPTTCVGEKRSMVTLYLAPRHYFPLPALPPSPEHQTNTDPVSSAHPTPLRAFSSLTSSAPGLIVFIIPRLRPPSPRAPGQHGPVRQGTAAGVLPGHAPRQAGRQQAVVLDQGRAEKGGLRGG